MFLGIFQWPSNDDYLTVTSDSEEYSDMKSDPEEVEIMKEVADAETEEVKSLRNRAE